jgi:copper chaperone NosL
MRKMSYQKRERIRYPVSRISKVWRDMQHGIRSLPLTIWLSPILLLVVSACGGNANAELAPPTVHYGEDVCEFCGMIVSEEAYTAGYVTRDGHGHTFDDIGDMVQSHLKMQEDVRAFFVHDYESKAWIRAETAHYVLSRDLPTPMLSGLAAFAAAEKATDFAIKVDGKGLTFDQLLTHYRENPPTPMSHGTTHN